MASFKWKEEYSVNVMEIDNQHKILLDIGERLVDLAMGKQDSDYYDQIMEVLEELKAYTIYHFGYEEKMMDALGYPMAETHKFEHHLFVKKVEQLGRKDIDGQQSEVILNLLTFVADWVTNHITQQDQEYGKFLNGTGMK